MTISISIHNALLIIFALGFILGLSALPILSGSIKYLINSIYEKIERKREIKDFYENNFVDTSLPSYGVPTTIQSKTNNNYPLYTEEDGSGVIAGGITSIEQIMEAEKLGKVQ